MGLETGAGVRFSTRADVGAQKATEKGIKVLFLLVRTSTSSSLLQKGGLRQIYELVICWIGFKSICDCGFSNKLANPLH